MALNQTFLALALHYTDDIGLAETLWEEIQKSYSGQERHYHTLSHLEQVFRQLSEVQAQIQDWDALLFSLFYHDIIYDPSGSDNEEKSAALARERLQALSFPPERTARCVAHILATKGHEKSDDPDTNLFTDADLSVLGQSQKAYADYSQRIRKEYAIYPDELYNAGRKQALSHFLRMDRIFKTDHFFSNYEDQARRNMTRELQAL